MKVETLKSQGRVSHEPCQLLFRLDGLLTRFDGLGFGGAGCVERGLRGGDLVTNGGELSRRGQETKTRRELQRFDFLAY